MAEEHPEEIRVRVTVDSDTPELLKRLASSKRQAREIVHLLRLGLQMEKMLDGRGSVVAIAAEAGGLDVRQTSASVAPNSAPAVTHSLSDIPLSGEFAEMTGLDADYFSVVPGAYSD